MAGNSVPSRQPSTYMVCAILLMYVGTLATMLSGEMLSPAPHGGRSTEARVIVSAKRA